MYMNWDTFGSLHTLKQMEMKLPMSS